MRQFSWYISRERAEKVLCLNLSIVWLLNGYTLLHRESLLLAADDSDHNLQVFLKVIDLLAACCEGENLYIESLCQNMMSIGELMKVRT